MVRVENIDALLDAHAQGKGVLILTGHFGNFEVATAAGLAQLSRRRTAASTSCAARSSRAGSTELVTRRFRGRASASLPKRGGLDAILDRLAAGDLIVFPFDQHARPQGRRAGRVLRPPGRHLPQPGRDRPAPPARRWCRHRAGAKPTAATCCASRQPLAPIECADYERGDPPQHARLQRARWSA